MSTFKDHFSGHADIYREARPTYPPALFAWRAEQAPATQLVWDVGCGNGQATLALAEHFTRVVGTDPSAAQIANAPPRVNVNTSSSRFPSDARPARRLANDDSTPEEKLPGSAG